MNSALSKHFMIIYDEEEPQIKISWDGSGAVSEWLTSFRHPKIPPSLYPEKITPKAISDFCESRQPPRTRFDIDYLLAYKYKLREYLPIQMCRISHGITHSDDLWMLFENQEKPEYENIKVR